MWERDFAVCDFLNQKLERESEWEFVLTKMAFKEFSIYRKSRCSSGVVCVIKVRVLLGFDFPRGA